MNLKFFEYQISMLPAEHHLHKQQLSLHSPSPDQELNPEPAECEAGMLTNKICPNGMKH
jgi:hypothetical protein